MIFAYLILIVFAVWLAVVGTMLMITGGKMIKEHQPDSMDILSGVSLIALGLVIIFIGLGLVF